MTSVATFELKFEIDLPNLKAGAEQYWHGQGYRVDILKWRPNQIICVLEYFYMRDSHELNMMARTAKYLLSISQDNFLFYYRCFDFVGDLDQKRENYSGGRLMGNLQVDDLLLPAYQPSMASPDIWMIID